VPRLFCQTKCFYSFHVSSFLGNNDFVYTLWLTDGNECRKCNFKTIFFYFYRQTLIFLLFKSDGDVDLHNGSLDNNLSSNLEPWNKTVSADHVGKNV